MADTTEQALAKGFEALGKQISDLPAAALSDDDIKGMRDAATEATKVATECGTLVKSVERIRERLDELEAARKDIGASDEAAVKDWFGALTESDSYKEWKGQNYYSPSGAAKVNTPSLIFPSDKAIEDYYKATTIDASRVGDWPEINYRAGLIEGRGRRLGVLSRIGVVRVGQGEKYRFKRETEKSNRGALHTTVTSDVAAVDTTLPLASTNGMYVGQTLRLHSTDETDEGAYDVTIQTVDSATQVTLTAAVGYAVDSGDDVTSESYTGTAESATKPYGLLEVEEITVDLQTIAIMMAVTQNRINSSPALRAFAERKMRRRQIENITRHVLYGDPDTNSTDLQGFWTVTGVSNILWSGGEPGDNRLDVVLRGIDDVEAEGYSPSVAMNPRDVGRMLRQKDADGTYTFNKPGAILTVDGGAPRLAGYEVVKDDQIVQSDFLIADFAEASEMVDRGVGDFSVGWINAQFAQNELTMRYEEMLAHAVLTTKAYKTGQWDSRP